MQMERGQSDTLRNGWTLPARPWLAALLCLSLLAPYPARAVTPGMALVIGEASYSSLPHLQACAMSAHSVAAALRRLGLTVDEQVDASSGAVFASIATLTRHIKADPSAPVFLYVCGYASAFDGRPFLLPVSAQVTRPADLLTQGVLAKSLMDAVTQNTKAPAVIALDAIPAPNAPDSLSLNRLAQDLPNTVGLLAVHDISADDRPTAFAALLAPALKGPAVQSTMLLADLKLQLSAAPKVRIAALHPPADQLYLAGAPASAPVPAAPPVPTAAAGTSVASHATDHGRDGTRSTSGAQSAGRRPDDGCATPASSAGAGYAGLL